MKRTQKEKEELIEQIRIMSNAGKSNTAIAKELGMKMNTVRIYKHDAGITQEGEKKTMESKYLYDEWTRVHEWYLRYKAGDLKIKAISFSTCLKRTSVRYSRKLFPAYFFRSRLI